MTDWVLKNPVKSRVCGRPFPVYWEAWYVMKTDRSLFHGSFSTSNGRFGEKKRRMSESPVKLRLPGPAFFVYWEVWYEEENVIGRDGTLKKTSPETQ